MLFILRVKESSFAYIEGETVMEMPFLQTRPILATSSISGEGGSNGLEKLNSDITVTIMH